MPCEPTLREILHATKASKQQYVHSMSHRACRCWGYRGACCSCTCLVASQSFHATLCRPQLTSLSYMAALLCNFTLSVGTLLDTTRLALTSPDIIDSSTSPAPLRSTMSQVALPRCTTTTSPGTSRRDDKAMMRPTHTNGTTHCWSRTLQLAYRTVRITYSYFPLCIYIGPCRQNQTVTVASAPYVCKVDILQ